MNKILCLCFLLIYRLSLLGQEVELLYGGINHYKLRDICYGHDIRVHNASHKPMIGFGMSELFRSGIYNLRLEALLYRVQRTYTISNGGLGASSSSMGSIRSTDLAVRLYPISIKRLKIFNFNIGLAWTPSLSFKESGVTNNYAMQSGSSFMSYDISKKPLSVNSVGWTARLAYNILLNKNWKCTPQYHLGYGTYGTIMHNVCLGVGYIKKTK